MPAYAFPNVLTTLINDQTPIDDIATFQPVYLKLAEAEENWQKAHPEARERGLSNKRRLNRLKHQIKTLFQSSSKPLTTSSKKTLRDQVILPKTEFITKKQVSIMF